VARICARFRTGIEYRIWRKDKQSPTFGWKTKLEPCRSPGNFAASWDYFHRALGAFMFGPSVGDKYAGRWQLARCSQGGARTQLLTSRAGYRCLVALRRATERSRLGACYDRHRLTSQRSSVCVLSVGCSGNRSLPLAWESRAPVTVMFTHTSTHDGGISR